MYLLLDNYDSFTWNIYHLLGSLGIDATVKRNDAISVDEALHIGQKAIIISPGPCTPNDAGISLRLVAGAFAIKRPLFGICLGMQSIVQHFGGTIEEYTPPYHGKISTISNYQLGALRHAPATFKATRYHSLICQRNMMPACLDVTADSDGHVMAVRHKDAPIEGMQFHPESVSSEHGQHIMQQFLSDNDAL